MRRGSVVTRMHIAGGYRLRQQVNTHRRPAAGGGDGQHHGETNGSQSERCSRESNQTEYRSR
jgi:hypothetical protein